MKGLIRRVSSGERGFTLIELLVVIAILGVIAAVVVLNIGGFMNRGTVQAANTELHQVQTAIVAYMTETDDEFTAGDVKPGSSEKAGAYLLNPGALKAEYAYDATGKVTKGTAIAGGWSGIEWSSDGGQWIEAS